VVLAGVAARAADPAPERTPFQFEMTGGLLGTSAGETWRTVDTRLYCNSSRVFTPFFSFASQRRGGMEQQVYNGSTYIHVNRRFYAIAGAGGSTERGGRLFFPRFRFDVTALGQVGRRDTWLTFGYSRLRLGGRAQVFSPGIQQHFKRAIVNASLNVTRVDPGGQWARSAQASVMVGQQGKRWVGGGVTGGRVAYQSLGVIPLDVRYSTWNAFAFLRQWLGRNWGLLARYEHTSLRSLYRVTGGHVGVFHDF